MKSTTLQKQELESEQQDFPSLPVINSNYVTALKLAKAMMLTDDTRIPFDQVMNIESDRFNGMLERE